MDRPAAWENRMAELGPGSVIQIAPDHKWACCLAEVDEVAPWGVKAFVRIPANDGAPPGDAFIRLSHGEFEAVGAHVVWRRG